MFEFEDFLKTSSRDMQTLGQAIDQEELKIAFRGCSDAVMNHFLDNVSERLRVNQRRYGGLYAETRF